jgi:hypothetical protein
VTIYLLSIGCETVKAPTVNKIDIPKQPEPYAVIWYKVEGGYFIDVENMKNLDKNIYNYQNYIDSLLILLRTEEDGQRQHNIRDIK